MNKHAERNGNQERLKNDFYGVGTKETGIHSRVLFRAGMGFGRINRIRRLVHTHMNQKVIRMVDEWKVVMEEVARSKIYRVNWRARLGVSLAAYCASNFKEGKTARQTFDEILIRNADLTEKEVKNLLNSVSARFAYLRGDQRIFKNGVLGVKWGLN